MERENTAKMAVFHMPAGARSPLGKQLDACQVPPPVRGVVAERGVGADDCAKRIRYNREVASAKHNVDLIFTQAGVYAIADAAEAEDRSMLQRGRQGHARRASKGRCAAGDSGAIGGFIEEHCRGRFARKQYNIGREG